MLQDFFKSIKLDPLNTRAFKHADGSFEVTIGSIEEGTQTHPFNGHVIKVTKGEFKPFLEELVYWLSKAIPYCANDLQKEMLEYYIKSYTTGSIDDHKDSQRKWIKDKGPVVECN
jgi:dipeptidyl-peptidase-3